MCGTKMDAVARFCPSCGRPFGASVPPSASAGAFPTPKAGVPPWVYWSGGAALVLVAVFLGLSAAGMFRAKAPETPNSTLRAQGSAPTPILQAQGAAPDSPLRAGAEHREMPAHIRDWLEHLRKTEERRVKASMDQLADAMVLFTTAKMGDSFNVGELIDPESNMSTSPTLKRTKIGTEQMDETWKGVEEFFHSVPPPAECVPIRDEYQGVLENTRVLLLDIVEALNRSDENPQEAMKTLFAMQGKSTSKIDQPAMRTDTLVSDVCRSYDTQKWFSITGDVGQSVFSKFGF
ncbi:MAG: zinc ribbon domain-containing protein [Fimbriimonadaceae bacterium]|nr:zinc ribbon domain-containing protein [Fimbriimonadaceae bacterium]